MKNNSSGTLRRILKELKPYALLAVLSLFLAVVSVALTLYLPILTGEVVDEIIGPGEVDFSGIFSVLRIMAVVIAFTALSQWLMSLINNRIVYRVSSSLREKAFMKIQALPLSYLDSHATGDLLSRLIADVDQFSDGLLMGFSKLFTGAVTIAGTLLFMLSVNGWMTLVVAVLTPVSLLVANFIAKRTYRLFLSQSKTRGEQTALINEMIENEKVVQAFGREELVQEQFDEVNERLRKDSEKAVFYSSLTNPSTRFVNGLVYAAVALSGALFVIYGRLSVGGLTAFLSYANQYTKPFNDISGVVTELQNAFACAGRIFELIDEPAEAPDPEPSEELPENPQTVSVKDVAFSYNKEEELIRDLSLTVKAGERVAIVGPTGAGKTTVINLLMRFYDTDKGSISIEGKDIRTLKRRDVRSCYGMVLQDTWIRTGTVRENIRMGNPSATDDEVKEAAREAHADGFIRRLPNGYDTVLGEGGGSLSQGQKQQLCIARVMLSHPSMLILDEATSSIDTRTELQIQSTFLKLMEGHTSFIVAHRLSTIRDADLILVMKDGKIVEQGTHEELLSRNGFYAELYRSQFDSSVEFSGRL